VTDLYKVGHKNDFLLPVLTANSQRWVLRTRPKLATVMVMVIVPDAFYEHYILGGFECGSLAFEPTLWVAARQNSNPRGLSDPDPFVVTCSQEAGVELTTAPTHFAAITRLNAHSIFHFAHSLPAAFF